MKDESIKEQFIELRSGGLSFDKIAKRINVCKPTLIQWQKDFQKKINELQEIRYKEILEKYSSTKENRIERIAKELETAWKEYHKAGYKDMTKKEILMIIMRLEKRLREEVEPFEEMKEDEDDKKKDFKIIVERVEVGREEMLKERDKMKTEI